MTTALQTQTLQWSVAPTPRNPSNQSQLVAVHPLGRPTNLDCRTAASYIHIEECEREGQVYRFVLMNPTLRVDGFWSCRRINDQDLGYYEGSSDPVLVNINTPFFLSEVEVIEEARTAHVLMCVSNETVVEWNHSGEDGYDVTTYSGDMCGGVGMFIVTSVITKMAEGETEFVMFLKTPSCEGHPDYAPVQSEAVKCSCLKRTHEIPIPCPTAAPTTTTTPMTCPPVATESQPDVSQVTCPQTTTTEHVTVRLTSESTTSSSGESQEQQASAEDCEEEESPATIAFVVIAVVQALILAFLIQQNMAAAKQVT